jgi:TonB family protein
MYINEKGIKRLAFVISLVLHLVILFVFVPHSKLKIEAAPKKYHIPVQMVVQKKNTLPKGDSRQLIKKKKNQKRVSKKKYAKKYDKGKPKSIASMPGDRKKPVITSSVDPLPPKEALNNEWSGKVVVDITIDKKGNPIKHSIVKSTGHEVLDTAFVKTIKMYYKFKPKRVMGKNVVGRIRLTYTF